MKYFSIKCWSKWDEADPIGKAYKQYIQSIRAELPSDLQLLTGAGGDISLNDGTIRKYFVSLPQACVDVEMDCDYEDPNGAFGERMVSLHYKAVEAFSSSVDPDSGRPLFGAYGDHGFDEIELVENGLYEHRMLFDGGIEIAIRFRDFSLSYVDIPYTPKESKKKKSKKKTKK